MHYMHNTGITAVALCMRTLQSMLKDRAEEGEGQRGKDLTALRLTLSSNLGNCWPCVGRNVGDASPGLAKDGQGNRIHRDAARHCIHIDARIWPDHLDMLHNSRHDIKQPTEALPAEQ